MPIRAIFFDVGETLIDETRLLHGWADTMGVDRAEFLATLDDIIAEQRFHRDRSAIDRFMNSDEEFHDAIAAAAKLPRVWSYLKPAKVHIDRARWLTVPFLGRMTPVIGEHEEIRNALARHDPEAALTMMTAHLQAVIPDIASLKTQFPDFFL